MKKLYRISFHYQGKIYELYAKSVVAANLPGFIEISGITFGEVNSVVIDPSEEKLKDEFANIEVTHIPYHSVIRIDQVNRQGSGKIKDVDPASVITPFPQSFTDHKKHK